LDGTPVQPLSAAAAHPLPPVELPEPELARWAFWRHGTRTVVADGNTPNRDDAPTGDPIARRGVVAVLVRSERALLIRRAEGIAAPGAYCFPGGGIEPGESEPDALRRELIEELSLPVHPRRRVWECVTPWGVHLSWWTADYAAGLVPRPNPDEVAAVLWRRWEEMRSLPGLLASNLAFLDALARGEIQLDAGMD